MDDHSSLFQGNFLEPQRNALAEAGELCMSAVGSWCTRLLSRCFSSCNTHPISKQKAQYSNREQPAWLHLQVRDGNAIIGNLVYNSVIQDYHYTGTQMTWSEGSTDIPWFTFWKRRLSFNSFNNVVCMHCHRLRRNPKKRKSNSWHLTDTHMVRRDMLFRTTAQTSINISNGSKSVTWSSFSAVTDMKAWETYHASTSKWNFPDNRILLRLRILASVAEQQTVWKRGCVTGLQSLLSLCAKLNP